MFSILSTRLVLVSPGEQFSTNTPRNKANTNPSNFFYKHCKIIHSNPISLKTCCGEPKDYWEHVPFVLAELPPRSKIQITWERTSPQTTGAKLRYVWGRLGSYLPSAQQHIVKRCSYTGRKKCSLGAHVDQWNFMPHGMELSSRGNVFRKAYWVGGEFYEPLKGRRTRSKTKVLEEGEEKGSVL